MKFIRFLVTFCFFLTCLGPYAQANKLVTGTIYAVPYSDSKIVPVTNLQNSAIVKGLTIYPQNPLQFDFIVEPALPTRGHVPEGAVSPSTLPNELGLNVKATQGESDSQLKQESLKMIKYFLASLTTPEKDMWVNLSPYEKNRIVPDAFGQTLMGRDLLGEDYTLKQMTASLIHPDTQLGKEFWSKVYAQAQARYGTTQIAINTFNKVWITPDKATVWEHNNSAFVIERHLKVMLEEDYVALDKNQTATRGHVPEGAVSPSRLPSKLGLNVKATQRDQANALSSQIVRSIIIPALEYEVNEGASFAQLRQIYNAMILATWYKKRLKDSLLGQVYVNQNKIKGVEWGMSSEFGHEGGALGKTKDPQPTTKPITQDSQLTPNEIYSRYLQTFKKGVFNFIKEEPDPITHEMIPRKYFSGGAEGLKLEDLAIVIAPLKRLPESAKAALPTDHAMKITFTAVALPTASKSVNTAMRAQEFRELFLHSHNLRDPTIVDKLDVLLGFPSKAMFEGKDDGRVHGEATFNVPSSYASIRNILAELKLTKDDVVYDLGSAFGRFVLTTALTTPAKRIEGIEIVESRVRRASEAAKDLGLGQVSFRNSNLKDFSFNDLKDATVLYLFEPFSTAPQTAYKVLSEIESLAKIKKNLRIVSIGLLEEQGSLSNKLRKIPHLKVPNVYPRNPSTFIIFESNPATTMEDSSMQASVKDARVNITKTNKRGARNRLRLSQLSYEDVPRAGDNAPDIARFNREVSLIKNPLVRQYRKKVIRHLRYVSPSEFESRLKVTVDALNERLKSVESYAVLVDEETGKSKAWATALASPFLVKKPQKIVYSTPVGLSHIRNVQTLVIFDDMIVSGNQLADLLRRIKEASFGSKKTVILAVPFLSQNIPPWLKKIENYWGVNIELLSDKKKKEAYEAIPVIRSFVGDVGSRDLDHVSLYFAHHIPDRYSFPEWLRELITDHGRKEVIEPYKRPGKYKEIEQQSFRSGILDEAMTSGDPAMQAVSPQIDRITAAELLKANYRVDDPQTAQRLARRIQAEDTVSEEKDGFTILKSLDGSKILEISPRGTKRFFDEQGRWILRLDPSDRKTEQLKWGSSGDLEGTWMLSLDGRGIVLQNDGSGGSLAFYEDDASKNQIFTMSHPASIFSKTDHRRKLIIPLAKHVDKDSGIGSLLLQLMSLLALDQGCQLAYKSGIKFILDAFYYNLGDVSNPMEPVHLETFKEMPGSIFWQPVYTERIYNPRTQINVFSKVGQIRRAYIVNEQKTLINFGETEPPAQPLKIKEQAGRYALINGSDTLAVINQIGDLAMRSDDESMQASVHKAAVTKELGGIDLNSNLLDLSIKRDSHGIPLPSNMQDWAQIHINGLEPVIIKMEPVNLKELLG